MPVNRNALIRYKTLDQCLQNRFRKWTLEDLIDACSDALYEYEGIDKGVSRRTVQGDIQMMRSDKLGYNAPIIVVDKKYYTYEDSDYSITNIPLSDQDLNMLTEAVEFMKQFQGFSHFRELDGMVQKLEGHIYAQKTSTQPVIDFEKNENLKGLKYLDPLYQAIIKKQAIKISYQSFKARSINEFVFHPYLLKEFRNRWFVIGVRNDHSDLLNLALDRIEALDSSPTRFKENTVFDPSTYFDNAIGVTVSRKLSPEEVLLFVKYRLAPYVLTKPLHHSQEEVSRDNYGVVLRLKVQHNFELEKEILALGDEIKVIAPTRLRNKIKDRLREAVDLYETEINESRLANFVNKVKYKGAATFNYVYTQREIRKLKSQLDKYFKKPFADAYPNLFEQAPALKDLIFNKNIHRIIAALGSDAQLIKATYFWSPKAADKHLTWHQDLSFKSRSIKKGKESVLQNIFSIRVHLDDTNQKNGALKLIPGSHKKILNAREIALITENSIPQIGEVQAGGVQIIQPMILHAITSNHQQKNRRLIHLEFYKEG